mgnify:FL=1|jgi:3-methyladenine DNA glycosylase Tag
MWKPKIRHEIEQRTPQGECIVKVFDENELVEVLQFNACNAALSWVERKEESYSYS